MALRDYVVTARPVYGRSLELEERRVRPDRRTPPPLDYPYGEAGSGPPLLLVHGMVDQQEAWRFTRDALAKHFRVLTLDMPGCNHMPRRGEATVEGYVDFLHEFTSSLGLERFFLVGMSSGATVVLQYAARFPGRVGGVALASLPLARPNPASLRLGRFLARHKRGRWLPALVGGVKASRLYVHFLINAVTHHAKDNFDFNLALLAQGQRSSDALTWLDTYESVQSIDAEALLEELARAGVPYLGIFGEGDGLIALERLGDVGALRGHARVLPGAKHCVHLEQSEAFNAAVAEFFLRCAGSGGAPGGA